MKISSNKITRVQTQKSTFYVLYNRTSKGLYQYTQGKWVPKTKNGKILAKTATEWYGVLEAAISGPFSIVEVDHMDFVNVLRQDGVSK